MEKQAQSMNNRHANPFGWVALIALNGPADETSTDATILEPHFPGVTVNGISIEEFPTLAKRPAYSLLDKSKITAAFGLEVPDWREMLTDVLAAQKTAA